jgi:hypothetical protein
MHLDDKFQVTDFQPDGWPFIPGGLIQYTPGYDTYFTNGLRTREPNEGISCRTLVCLSPSRLTEQSTLECGDFGRHEANCR